MTCHIQMAQIYSIYSLLMFMRLKQTIHFQSIRRKNRWIALCNEEIISFYLNSCKLAANFWLNECKNHELLRLTEPSKCNGVNVNKSSWNEIWSWNKRELNFCIWNTWAPDLSTHMMAKHIKLIFSATIEYCALKQ